jgi:GNAT superfamily N-acetyltransferase
MTAEPAIRAGLDSDAEAFIALIWSCWSRYPGIRLDVDGEMPELRALASYYGAKGGRLWAAEAEGRLVGMIATCSLVAGEASGVWEICRVYVDPALHGAGLGHALLDLAETHAIDSGASRLVLWTDTRFDRAHRFYEKRSYVRSGPVRVLHDISNSLEYVYAKPVDGIEVLDAAGALSAVPRLSAILIDCVAEGTGMVFLPPLAPETARGFWRETARGVAGGTQRLLAGWVAGVLVGTVTVSFATAQTQPHRANLDGLLVDPGVPGPDMVRRLMLRAEAEAGRAERTMLLLQARDGSPEQAVSRDLGWREVGRLPRNIRRQDGTEADTLLLWKMISWHLSVAQPSEKPMVAGSSAERGHADDPE